MNKPQRFIYDMGDGTSLVYRKHPLSASDSPIEQWEKICEVASEREAKLQARNAELKHFIMHNVSDFITDRALLVEFIRTRTAKLEDNNNE